MRTAMSLTAGILSVLLSAGLAVAGDISVKDAKARVIVPTNPAAAYFTVEDAGDADRLIGVASPAFARAEIHTHKVEDGLARMIKVDGIDIPAKGQAALKTGGDHVMLFEAEKPLKVGDSFPLTLSFEKAGDVEVTVIVAPLKDTMSHEGHGRGHSGEDHSKMDHSKMDHSKMDHSKMDHSKTDDAKAKHGDHHGHH